MKDPKLDKTYFWGLTEKRFLVMATTFVFVIAADQVSKFWIMARFQRGELLPVIEGFFNLTLTFNKGAAFGLFSGVPDGMRQLLLAATTLLALSAVLYFMAKDFRGHLVAQIALSMILGGALGNIIDRLRLGEVIDFIDWYWNRYHWPAFNLADSAICVGVFLLLFCRPPGRKPEEG